MEALALGLVAITLIAIVARRKTVVRLGPSTGFVQERASVCDKSLALMSPNIDPQVTSIPPFLQLPCCQNLQGAGIVQVEVTSVSRWSKEAHY